MAEYPGVENERRFPQDELQRLVQAIFERCGMAPADAGVLADQLVMADVRGIHSHGVIRVPLYVRLGDWVGLLVVVGTLALAAPLLVDRVRGLKPALGDATRP